MTLRVGCDLDGTIADMESALQREAERLFGSDVVVRPAGSTHLEAPADVDAPAEGAPKVDVSAGKKSLTSRQLRQLWPHVATIENFWTTFEEIEPRSGARIHERRTAHGRAVIFVTH